jgi:CRP/FNR family cyclic AMP-dependent transcriptional regulator
VIQQFLRQLGLFKDLDDEDLTHLLMIGLVRKYREGAPIIKEGVPGGRLHVICRGRVRISKIIPEVGEEALVILDAGNFFGEIELLDGGPASASAIAHCACETFSIPHGELKAMLASRPALSARFLWVFAETLATRLRETDRRLASVLALAREP